LRSFRASIKKKWQSKHGKKYYFWVRESQEQKTREFFVNELGVDRDYYKRY
jgi:hypothetical protein